MLRALDLLNSKFSVIFLDVRDHEVCTGDNRQEMIDKAKADYTKLCDELVEKGTLDLLTVCALARPGTFLRVGFFTAAVWCVPALRVPLVHSLINHFRQKALSRLGAIL